MCIYYVIRNMQTIVSTFHYVMQFEMLSITLCTGNVMKRETQYKSLNLFRVHDDAILKYLSIFFY